MPIRCWPAPRSGAPGRRGRGGSCRFPGLGPRALDHRGHAGNHRRLALRAHAHAALRQHAVGPAWGTSPIVGAGAVGSIVGVQLSRAGHHVRFVEVNRDHVAAVLQDGLKLSGAVEATIRPEIMLPEEVTGPLSAGAAGGEIAAHRGGAGARGRPSGAGSVRSLAAERAGGIQDRASVGPARTIGDIPRPSGAIPRGPGEVNYGGPGTFRLGEIDGAIDPRVRALRTIYSVQPVEVTDNIFGYLWGKMALGAIYSARHSPTAT